MANQDLVQLGERVGTLVAKLERLGPLEERVRELEKKCGELERGHEKHTKRWDDYDDLDEDDGDQVDKWTALLEKVMTHPMAAPVRDALMDRLKSREFIDGVLDRLPAKKP